jgi:two-component system chemotaxis response regulator CheY
MLSGHVERWRVVEAVKLGVNEFLCKPVSAKGLQERLISILIKPRTSVRAGEYYGPVPRSPMLKKDLAGFGEMPATTDAV